MNRHEITRVRHELARRTLSVTEVETLSPNMRRLHFSSPDLADFPSVGFDDHVKIFIGELQDQDGRPEMRDFTPRRFDRAAGTLAIDFALHDAGPATSWAKAATVGETIQIGGPRGSAVIPDDFDWYWLIGDMSALPAIGRKLEELRSDVPVTTVVLLEDKADLQAIETRADWTACWLQRGRGASLAQTIASMTLPHGEGFVWIAGEASEARDARYAIEALGQPKKWIKAAGYWQRGNDAVHIKLDD